MNVNKHWLEPDWPAPANIRAATTLRSGGVSAGAFASLNPATHVGDDPEAVRQNRRLIATMLDLPSEPIWLAQVHSNVCVAANANHVGVQADASYSDQSGVVCAVMTADCLPVLLCSADGKEIAAIHAGWRGLVDGVIDSATARFINRDILAWLGPAIGSEAFEVGEEVRGAYLAKSKDYAAGFKPNREGKWLADIYQLARVNLGHLGISDIYGGGLCTASDKTRFFSYRRDHTTGRIATLIWRT